MNATLAKPEPCVEALALHEFPMGATPLRDSKTPATVFRVWAPNAQAVELAGAREGGEWNDCLQPLTRNEAGVWEAAVEGIGLGDSYKYRIQTPGGEWVYRRDPYGLGVTLDHTASVITETQFDWQCEAFQMAPWNELVIYEMHVGTFRGKEDRPSTFKDCMGKIPYLKELGINAISVMPICSFPGDYSWGYNPTDFFAVENAYGGRQQFKQFIDACHTEGIAVMLDLVYNHAGPTDIDLWQFDGWQENDGGGIYFYNDHRAETPWGHTRFDYGRGEVRQFLHDNFTMWMEEFRLDGARFDATIYIRKIDHVSKDDEIAEGWSMMQWLNETKNQRYPWKLTISEDIGVNPWVVKTVGEGGAGYDAQWDNEFVRDIREQLTLAEDAHRNMETVKAIIDKKFSDNAFQRVIYSESHDDVANGHARISYEIDGNEGDDRSFYAKKRSILGAGLVLTAPGIPMLFQGQEMLENLWFEDTDPMSWKLAEKYKGIIQAHSDLIRLRRNFDDTTRGLRGHHCHTYHVNNRDKVVAFHRWEHGGQGDDVVVIANFGGQAFENYTLGLPKPGLWKVRFNSSSTLYDPHIDNAETVDTEAVEGEYDGHPWNGRIGLGSYALVVVSQ